MIFLAIRAQRKEVILMNVMDSLRCISLLVRVRYDVDWISALREKFGIISFFCSIQTQTILLVSARRLPLPHPFVRQVAFLINQSMKIFVWIIFRRWSTEILLCLWNECDRFRIFFRIFISFVPICIASKSFDAHFPIASKRHELNTMTANSNLMHNRMQMMKGKQRF